MTTTTTNIECPACFEPLTGKLITTCVNGHAACDNCVAQRKQVLMREHAEDAEINACFLCRGRWIDKEPPLPPPIRNPSSELEQEDEDDDATRARPVSICSYIMSFMTGMLVELGKEVEREIETTAAENPEIDVNYIQRGASREDILYRRELRSIRNRDHYHDFMTGYLQQQLDIEPYMPRLHQYRGRRNSLGFPDKRTAEGREWYHHYERMQWVRSLLRARRQ
jgi:hypothetical protein